MTDPTPSPCRLHWRVTLDFSLPREVVTNVTALAKLEDRSRSRWIERALEAWLVSLPDRLDTSDGRLSKRQRVCITVKPKVEKQLRAIAATWNVSISAIVLAAVRAAANNAQRDQETHKI